MINSYDHKVWERGLFEFPVAEFVERSAGAIAIELSGRGYKGIVFGASGGIDSLLTAALCARALKKNHEWHLFGLQMNDSRIKGESYNPEIYEAFGVNFKRIDITKNLVTMERNLGLPPRWLTVLLVKTFLSLAPLTVKRKVILEIKAGSAPGWMLKHYQLLTLPHRLRITLLKEFAHEHHLMLVICANFTEISLGYFVEEGVDDHLMGDYAPLAGLYKTQVVLTAKYLNLPQSVIIQKPSPGFGGVYDEDLLGPYEHVDLTLLGFLSGYSDAEISHHLILYASASYRKGGIKKIEFCDVPYVQFLRRLAGLSTRKAQKQSIME